MECYIYFIINKITEQMYIGLTTNFLRRKREHLKALENNSHPNYKLLNAYNLYKKENFYFKKIHYENLTKEQLDNEEKKYIKIYNTFGEGGYNLTEGGTGGDTKSKLDFDQFCFAYFGGKKYGGMTNRIGKALDVDSSCISAIIREKSYDAFRERARKLSSELVRQILNTFEKEMDIVNNPPHALRSSPNDEDTFKIMCVVSTYGRGIEKAILSHFNLSKGFIYHLMTGNGRYEIKNKYKITPKEEIQKIGKKYFHEWNLLDYSKNKIKENYTNLLTKYNK